MTQVTPLRDLKGYLGLGQVKRLIAAASNLRDQALIAVLARDGIRISEASTPLSMTSAMGMARTYEDLH